MIWYDMINDNKTKRIKHRRPIKHAMIRERIACNILPLVVGQCIQVLKLNALERKLLHAN